MLVRRFALWFGLLLLVLPTLRSSGQEAAPLTPEQVKAAVTEAIKPLQESLEDLKGRVQRIEEGSRPRAPLTDAGGSPAAAPAEGQPEAAPAPGAAGQPPAAAGMTHVVPLEFWSVEMAKKSGVYYVEPNLPDAMKMLKSAFKQAATAIPARPEPFNQRQFMDLQILRFKDQLVQSGRNQEDQLQAWANFWELWMAAANKTLDPVAVPERREMFRLAFQEGAEDMEDWVEKVEEEHNKGTTRVSTTAANAGAASGSSTWGYLPPLTAFHYAWHLKKMRRIQSRGQSWHH